MAAKETPIPFTVGDQENIVEVTTLMREIHEEIKSCDLPSLPTRLSSLETTRKRAITAVIAILVTVVGGMALWGLKGLLAGAFVAGGAGAIRP